MIAIKGDIIKNRKWRKKSTTFFYVYEIQPSHIAFSTHQHPLSSAKMLIPNAFHAFRIQDPPG